MNLMRLMATLGLDSSGFEKGVKGAESSGQQLANKLEGYFKKAAKALTVGAITKKLYDLAKVGFDYNKQIENLTANFEVLLGSADAASRQIEQLKVMAAKTPFGLADLADATKTLLAFQVPAEQSTELLRELGDIALGDKQKLSGLALVMGQVASAGKLSGQDLMQFINQGFNPLNEIVKRTGESMEQVRDRMSKGKVTYEEVALAIKAATSEGGQFYQGMEKAAGTVEGQFSTLTDNWHAFLGQIMEPVNEQVSGKILPALINGLQKVSDALFGTGEEAEEMRKKLWGEDEEGNAVDPGANLANWLTELMQTWTDGIAEDNETVEGFVNTFKANTKLIKDALSERYANAVDEEEKTAIAAQIEEIKGYETEVEALLQKRAGGYITEEEETRLNTILSTLQQIKAETEAAAGIDKVQSSWDKLVNTGGDILAAAIEKVTGALAWFLSDDGATARQIAGIALAVVGAVKSVNLLRGALVLLGSHPVVAAVTAIVALIVAKSDEIMGAVDTAWTKIQEIFGPVEEWLLEHFTKPMLEAYNAALDVIGLGKNTGGIKNITGIDGKDDVEHIMEGYKAAIDNLHFPTQEEQSRALHNIWELITGRIDLRTVPNEEETSIWGRHSGGGGETSGVGAGRRGVGGSNFAGYGSSVAEPMMLWNDEGLGDIIWEGEKNLSENFSSAIDELKSQVALGIEQIGAFAEAIGSQPLSVTVYVNAEKLSGATATTDRKAQRILNRRTAIGYGQP